MDNIWGELTLEQLQDFIPDESRSDIPSTPKSLPPGISSGKYLSASHADFVLKLVAAYGRSLRDSLELYNPLEVADLFHASRARIRLLCGSNQAGKTLAAEVEFARLIRGMDPYEKRASRGLQMMAVGKDQDHLGQVMFKKLWYPGQFSILKDLDTGLWRAVRPSKDNHRVIDPSDKARKKEWQPAPPLLPPSSIKKLCYEKKGEGIPSQLVSTNDNEVIFCTSRGSPRNGIQLDVAHFDEELLSKEWLPETLPRLVARDGIFIWSLTPQASTPQAYGLHRRHEDGDPDVAEFTLLIDDNPYYSEESKRALFTSLAALGDDELAVRWFARWAIQGRAVYPMYDTSKFAVTQFEIPDNWMLVAAIDPGAQTAAALFGAVPPQGNEIHIFAELIVRNQDAKEFAKRFRAIQNGRHFEVFIMDQKGGGQTSMGRNDRVCDHYRKEFQDANVMPSRLSGTGFVWGSSVTDAREMSVKGFMSAGRLKMHSGAAFNLDRQIKNRYYDKNNPRRREARTEHDLVDCLEYMVAFFDESGIYYRPPPKPRSTLTRHDFAVYNSFLKKQKKRVNFG